MVLLKWKGDRLEVKSKAQDVGEVHQSIKASVAGGPGHIAFNHGYLVEYLQGKEGRVEMGVHSPSLPALFSDGSDPPVVLMPMLVQWDGEPADGQKEASQAKEGADTQEAQQTDASPASEDPK